VIVVADTTPLQYLILIQHEYILPALYGRVVVPPAVIAELSRAETPQPVREWLHSAPEWLEVTNGRSGDRREGVVAVDATVPEIVPATGTFLVV
jgi:predicted nucleic acid-binding protein